MKITLPKVWADECDEVAEGAWNEALDIITDHMQNARFANFLACGGENKREEVLQDMIFKRVFKKFAELAGRG